MQYSEFLRLGREAQVGPTLNRELRQLYAEPGGTLRAVVLMLLQQREALTEALLGRQMMSDQDIRAAIGTQGQINGLDIALQSIHEAMTKEPDNVEEVSTEQRSAVP